MLDAIVPLFPGMPGGPELLIVLFVLVLLFGANKIPKLARSTGQAMGEFKKGREEVEDELKEMKEKPKEEAKSAVVGESEATDDADTAETDTEADTQAEAKSQTDTEKTG